MVTPGAGPARPPDEDGQPVAEAAAEAPEAGPELDQRHRHERPEEREGVGQIFHRLEAGEAVQDERHAEDGERQPPEAWSESHREQGQKRPERPERRIVEQELQIVEPDLILPVLRPGRGVAELEEQLAGEAGGDDTGQHDEAGQDQGPDHQPALPRPEGQEPGQPRPEGEPDTEADEADRRRHLEVEGEHQAQHGEGAQRHPGGPRRPGAVAISTAMTPSRKVRHWTA